MKRVLYIILLIGVSILSYYNPDFKISDLLNNASSEAGTLGSSQDYESGEHVTGVGTVKRILRDDLDGSRHQKFIITLESGSSLLVAHNIDIAPRVPSISIGDRIEFSGVYETNNQGGVIHWTHHDPSGRHAGGWLKKNGHIYQ